MKKTLWVVLLVLAGVAAAAWWRFHAPSETQSVVVYVSHDEVFSEPILKDFERETGIRVRAVYDTEETKSTGAMNRLMAEKNNPQATSTGPMSRSAPKSCDNSISPPLTSRRTPTGSRPRFAILRATGPALRRGRACSLCTKMKIRNRLLCTHTPTHVGAAGR